MKENANIKFLNSIYQITEMGIIGINDVIDKVKKSNFKSTLEKEREEYMSILNECENIFTSYGVKERELGKMVKMSSKMMSEIKTMTSDVDSTVAKMMLEGTTKGIEKLELEINTYKETDEEAIILANNLLEMLKNNISELKKYL